jgi:hypothetical protein
MSSFTFQAQGLASKRVHDHSLSSYAFYARNARGLPSFSIEFASIVYSEIVTAERVVSTSWFWSFSLEKHKKENRQMPALVHPVHEGGS